MLTDARTLVTDMCSVASAKRVAAMLDVAPSSIVEGAPLPPNWHFPLLAAQTPRHALRADGFPGLGLPIPDLDLPRLLLVGRSIEFTDPLTIGAVVTRFSAIKTLDHKEDQRGARAIITLEHQLTMETGAEPAITETQTYMLLPATRYEAPTQGDRDTPARGRLRTITPDSTLLFHYSALGFNSHRIHLDRDYARSEGFPDLVVNGGLTALLLTEFARADLHLDVRSFAIKHRAPLFCDRPITLAAEQSGDRWILRAHADDGAVAAEMTVETR
jgi:3-methylfumaryl-CoA hydratase